MDGELDLLQNLEVEGHLQGCSACAQAKQAIGELRSAIKKVAAYHEAPPGLKARIHSAIHGAQRTTPGRTRLLRWSAAAAAILLAVIGGWGLLRFLPERTDASLLTEELLASHIRSHQLPGHLVDVESSDQHTVKPWFDGKLDFSPEVVDLGSQGFTLVGGRLDYLNGRSVAALVYQRRKHLINLFVWPIGQNSGAAASALNRQGYHLLSWAQAGMSFWVVSDLNESELRQFVELIQNQTRPH
jgi:anti-sigma factor RsiW